LIDAFKRLVVMRNVDLLRLARGIELEGPLLGLAVVHENQVLAVLVELQRGPLGIGVLALGRLQAGDFPGPLQRGLVLLQGGLVSLSAEHKQQPRGKRGDSD
jgi:hypothetical protein